MTVGSLSEAELITHARAGDASAWETLIGEHREPVFRLAYLLLGDPDDAEDVAQETFVRTHRNLDRFDESRPLQPWMMRIASNLASNRKRSLARYWKALERAARQQSSPDLGTK